MATYRQIHCTFWTNSEELTPEEKLFYLYLLTSPNTKQCGIMEVSKRRISFDTGIPEYSIDTLLIRFQELGNIYYSPETNEIALKNWRKYNPDTSPKVKSCILKELALVKDKKLIQYLYPIDTLSEIECIEENRIEENRIEREREKKISLKDAYAEILSHAEGYMQTKDYTGKTKDPEKLTNKFYDYMNEKYNGKADNFTLTVLKSKASNFFANER